jgi:hypothetical protein
MPHPYLLSFIFSYGELPRTPFGRSSQNEPSTQSGELALGT